MVKEYGLNVVPRGERNFSWWHLSLIWGGISFCLPTFMIGALPVPGLSWTDAIWVNVAGNAVCAILIALSGAAGVKYGLPSVVLWGDYFGTFWGNYVFPCILFLSTCGWFSILLAATADGLTEIFNFSNRIQSPLLMLLLGTAMTATATGSRFILLVSRASVPLLMLLIIYYFCYFVTPSTYPNTISYTPTGEISFLSAFNLIVSGYIVGALCACDFSRYAKNHTANWLGTIIGAGLVSLLLSIIGMYIKAATGSWNPLTAAYFYGSSLVSLVIIVLAAWTTNHALLYSAGLSLTKLLGARQPKASIVGAGITGTALAASGLISDLADFLNLLSCVFPAFLGLFLSHYYLAARKFPRLPPVLHLCVTSAALLLGWMTSLFSIEWASFAGLITTCLLYQLLQWLLGAFASVHKPLAR